MSCPNTTLSISSRLDGVCIFQELGELLLLALQLGVSTNVLLADEDVRNGALVGHVCKRILDIRTIIDLVEFDDVWLYTHLAEKGLGSLAVRAVGFRKDGNCIVVDDALSFSLCGHNCTWAGRSAYEESL